MTGKAVNNEVLWTAEAATQATGGRTNSAWTATGISIDSRQVNEGDLFVALLGPNFDGHKFVSQALKAGASAALVESRPEDVSPTAPLLIVENAEKALTGLGVAARERAKAKIVGVTGSVGKTGVKEVLRFVLSGMGRCAATEGNLNNHLGLPLSLARMAAETDFGVFEMGMNHPGELIPLSQISHPHVAIITTVEAVHVGNFESEEAIADAKAEIFSGMDKAGTAILNRDNRHFDRLNEAARNAGVGKTLSFGASDQADVRLLKTTADAEGSNIIASIAGKELSYRISLPGSHWAINSLAVLAAVSALNLDIEKAATMLAQTQPVKGRGERHIIDVPGGSSFILIDESYNASPASMRAALEVLGTTEPQEGGRRIAVLGDMLELGAAYADYHAELARPLEAAGTDLVFTAGRGMAHLRDALPPTMRGGHESTSERLIPMVLTHLRAGDVVMVKGSAGSRMGSVVEALKSIETAPSLAVSGG